MDATPPTIWADVEDLFGYTEDNPRPSGIQRLAFEALSALRELAGPARLRLVRHAASDTILRPVPWEALATLFGRLTAPTKTRRAAPRRPTLRGRSLEFVEALPPDIRNPLRRAGGLQREAAREFRALLGALRPAVDERDATPGIEGALGIERGDIYLVLGAAWTHPAFADRLAALKSQHGVHITLLMYDLIPLRRPEWCVRELSDRFAAWFAATLPLCDTLLAISRSTAQEVERYAREQGIALPGPIHPIPIGTGFGTPQAMSASLPLGLPKPGAYILFVSTMEARKNHILLFRLWRRLLEERGPAHVPDLVFAGREGWLIADLMQQLENTAWLGSKVRLIRDPSDAELRALYAGCQFTIFPSLYEGWGLPVSESLAFGKPCLCSGTTSLPESGGPLARYFDPESLASVHAAVTAILDDPAGLAAWESDVRQNFQPTPWFATAAALLHALPA